LNKNLLLTLEDEKRTRESQSSAELSPEGIVWYEEGDAGGGDMGSEGGGRDLNLGKLELSVWSENPRDIAIIDRFSTLPALVRRWWLLRRRTRLANDHEFAKVSKLPDYLLRKEEVERKGERICLRKEE